MAIEGVVCPGVCTGALQRVCISYGLVYTSNSASTAWASWRSGVSTPSANPL
jgi:hypothetical protein